MEKRKIIASLLKSGHSYSDIQKMAKCSRHLIADVAKEKTEADHCSLSGSTTAVYYE